MSFPAYPCIGFNTIFLLIFINFLISSKFLVKIVGGISFLKLIENNFSDIFLMEVGSLTIFTLSFIVSKNNVEVT